MHDDEADVAKPPTSAPSAIAPGSREGPLHDWTSRSPMWEPIGTRWKQSRLGRDGCLDFEEVATFELDVRQGDEFEQLPLRLQLSCRQIKMCGFTIGTRCAQIALIFEKGAMQFGSEHEVTQKSGSFFERLHSETQAEKGHSMELGGALRNTNPTLQAAIGLGGKSRDTARNTIDRERAYDLVSLRGKRFFFGEPVHGDILREHGLLTGTYPKKEKGDLPPLCLIKPSASDGTEPSEIIVTVVCLVDEADLDVRSNNIAARPFEKGAIVDIAQPQANHATKRHIADVERLREQFAHRHIADKLGWLSDKLQETVTPDEVVLCLETLAIKPAERT